MLGAFFTKYVIGFFDYDDISMVNYTENTVKKVNRDARKKF